MAISALPIVAIGTTSGNQPRIAHRSEDETETFKVGTPVALSSGQLIAWAGTDPTNTPVIAGIAAVPSSNLTTQGVAKTLTYGSVQNESSAVNIPVGAPPNDGKCAIFPGDLDTVFRAKFGNNAATQAPALTDIGVYYGLTLDSDSAYWYVDKNKATKGTNTCVQVTALDRGTSANLGTLGVNTLVHFKFQQDIIQAVT